MRVGGTAGAVTEHAPVVQTAPLLVRAETAAELLGVSRRTFERFFQERRLPDPLRLGRTRLWRYRDLEAFVEAGCRLDLMEVTAPWRPQEKSGRRGQAAASSCSLPG